MSKAKSSKEEKFLKWAFHMRRYPHKHLSLRKATRNNRVSASYGQMNNSGTKSTFPNLVSLWSIEKYDYWKFCEQRTQQIRSVFWKIGVWSITILFALVGFLFYSNTVKFEGKLVVKDLYQAKMISSIGVALAVIALILLGSIHSHLVKNYQSANTVKGVVKKTAISNSWKADTVTIFLFVLL